MLLGSKPMSGAKRILTALLTVSVVLLSTPVMALDTNAADGETATSYSPYVMAYDSLDVEDHSGYSTEYIFGMTKGIMRSTMVPALKPVMLLFTVPLDLVFLPFAAIGGFFR
jgi:hypothetical protein